MEIPNYFHFVATFADGTQIFQNESDVSPTDPQKNCFFDVLERSKTGTLVSFVITDKKHAFGVDLRDGHFEVNGVPFFQHRPEFADQRYKDFRLVYFRTPKIEIDANTMEPTRGAVGSYTIGWTASDPSDVEVKKTFTIYLENNG
jgi:hypothetical protein